MASFTDAIPQFNPYIQQLPVEAMVSVGMQKQQQYDQGIQRIQAQIDQVAGLDVYRPQDKQHLQSKLNELGSKLRTVAAGDFSNFQLVNSTAGMAASIAKDPIVMSAVQSTAVIKKNGQLMDEARQKGELTPDNEAYYNKFLNRYLESGLTDSQGKPITFNGKYIPHFDIFKYAKEVFNEVKPDGMTWDQVYETDGAGNPIIDPSTGKPIYSPVMIRMEKEGRFPAKVKETIDQIFSDPRVGQQLQITGEYNYRGLDSEALKERLIFQERNFTNSINDQIANLALAKNTSTSQEEKDLMQSQIENLQNTIVKNRSNYSSLLEIAENNPDAIRGNLYMDEVRNRYTTMFSETKTKQTTMTNPGWEANFKIQQETWDRYTWNKDFEFRVGQAEVSNQLKMMELQQKERENALKSARSTVSESVELANIESSYDKVQFLNTNFNQANDQYNAASNQFIWDAVYSNIPGNQERYNQLIKTNTPDEAINVIIEQDAKARGMTVGELRAEWEMKAEQEINTKGSENLQDDLIDSMTSYDLAKKNYLNWKGIKDNIDSKSLEKIDQTIGRLMTEDEIKPQTVKFRGRSFDLTKQDIIDLGVYIRGYKHVFGFAIDDAARQAAKSAEERLYRSGKGELLEYMMRTTVGGISPVSKVVRAVKSPIETLRDDWNLLVGDTDFDFSQVEKVYETIDNNIYTEGLRESAEELDKFLMVPGNLKTNLMTGNAEADRGTLINLKRIAAGYGKAGNLSSDFEAFNENISTITDSKDLNVEVLSRPMIGGPPQIEVVMYGENNRRVGGMTLQQDEALNFIDASNLYVPDEITSSQNFIASNGGKSSQGNPDDVNTYLYGDAYFKKSSRDFPNLTNFNNYDVMANVVEKNGGYYAKIFVHDVVNGKTYPVFTTKKDDYPTIYNSIKAITPMQIMSIVNSGNR